MVAKGSVLQDDLKGDNQADIVADLGRLGQYDDVISARRALLRTRDRWYPITVDLHKFMIAISRIDVNQDGKGGTAPDAMTWDKGGILETRSSYHRRSRHHAKSAWLFGKLLVKLVSISDHARGCRCLALRCLTSCWSLRTSWPSPLAHRRGGFRHIW